MERVAQAEATLIPHATVFTIKEADSPLRPSEANGCLALGVLVYDCDSG